MKFPISAATIFISAVFLTACSNQPVETAKAKDVPPTKVFNHSLTQATPGSVRITVKRDTGTKGALCSAAIAVDGKDVAEVGMSEKVSLYLLPGEHIIGARLSKAFPFCAGETAEVTANVMKEAVYRFGNDANGNFYINKTAW